MLLRCRCAQCGHTPVALPPSPSPAPGTWNHDLMLDDVLMHRLVLTATGKSWEDDARGCVGNLCVQRTSSIDTVVVSNTGECVQPHRQYNFPRAFVSRCVNVIINSKTLCLNTMPAKCVCVCVCVMISTRYERERVWFSVNVLCLKREGN